MNKTHKDIQKYRYEFKHDVGIVFKYYYGYITTKDIIDSWDFAIREGLIPKENKGFILDYRQASFKVDISECDHIPLYYQKHPEVFRGYKIAVVTENQQDIVIPFWVKEKDDGYESRPFSTLEAALCWVLD